MTKTLTQLGASEFIDDADLLLKRDDASGDDKKVTVGEAFASQRAIRQINVGGSSDYTLTTGDTGKPLIEFIGTLTNSINVIVPDTQRNYVFVNSTGGGFGITVKTENGTGFLFNASDVLYLRCDGVNVVRDIPTLAGGDEANFTAMPQVGGDPIVESGSNSDGEWTRWADGTQECSAIGSTTYTTSSAKGNIYFNNGQALVFPKPFTSNVTIAPIAAKAPAGDASLSAFYYSPTLTGATVGGYGASSTDKFNPAYIAKGRWK